MSKNVLIRTKVLSKNFYLRTSFFSKEKRYVKALDHVNLEIYRQETLGVVGESGCGKTTLGRVLLNLIKPTSGEVYFQGHNIYKMDHSEWRKTRKELQIVFQNPYLSFDSRFSILRSLSEPLITHTNLKKDEMEVLAKDTLERVGMPADAIYRYPHEFSGGQLQRIAVARALILNPKFIVLDEPTSALDVSVQAQILNLLRQLQGEFNLTYMFISHDLGVVQFISDRIAVMYLGKIVELINTDDLLAGKIQHPYTKILLSSIPEVYPSERHERIIVPKNIADATRPPSGCTFHPRCPYAMDICAKIEPQLQQIDENHWSACHLINESNVHTIEKTLQKEN